MRRQLVPALRVVLVFTVLLGFAYPLLVTGIAQGLWSHDANGSLIERGNTDVGSAIIGQQFTEARYFHPRPSAAGSGYDGTASAAANLGPTNPALLKGVKQLAAAYRRENGLTPGAKVPVDAVTSSGSGLDPGISVANARLQARRVARVRGLPTAQVLQLVGRHTQDRQLGVLGEKWVNVLELNLALDRLT